MVVLAASLNWVIIAVIPLCLLFILIEVLVWSKHRRMDKKQIPQDVLQDLDYVERRLNEDGKTNPREILWELAKSKSGRNRSFAEEKSRAGISDLHNEPFYRQQFSNSVNPRIADDQTDIGRIKRNIFRKRR